MLLEERHQCSHPQPRLLHELLHQTGACRQLWVHMGLMVVLHQDLRVETQTWCPMVFLQPSGGGQACPAAEQQECNPQTCDQDCVYTWADWSECTNLCGGGTRQRLPTITSTPVGGGQACPTYERQTSNTYACDTALYDVHTHKRFGGTSVNLEDGTVGGFSPGVAGQATCTAKCVGSVACTTFT